MACYGAFSIIMRPGAGGMTSQKKKIVITVGGTGGHIFPALGVAHDLQTKNPSHEILFIGGGLDKNRFFNPSAFQYHSVACGSIAHKNPLKLLASGCKIFKGIAQSGLILKRFKPDLVLGFGSYHTFPTLVSAKALRLPIILHEANSIPGFVNRTLSRHVVMTGLHFPDAAQHLNGSSLEVGMPMRKGFRRHLVDKGEALYYYNLNAGIPVLLVFGGSQGAQSLNKWMKEACVHSLFPNAIQVLHFTGNAALTEEMRSLYAQRGIKAVVKDFEPRMDFAWRAAKVALTRAGAGSISEAMEFEVPAILIPYPHAADNHQQKNAEFFSYTVGGSLTYPDDRFSSTLLAKTLRDLFLDQQRGLQHMREAIKSYKKKVRKRDLCDVVEEFLKG